ncbi:hypothetical protein [Bradyrhizobium mercantei]|uniref:hypothetical protein n=1 Tax=Bradyrhizobium mercantei TaxID=1904807 RepID=UPI0009785158|nr:hypothetical protein [Bradyrhizobium mercantei]
MSNTDPAPLRPLEPRQRNGCLTAFMLGVGVILLIPGVLCVIVSVAMGPGANVNPITIIVICLAFGGLALIVQALSRK